MPAAPRVSHHREGLTVSTRRIGRIGGLVALVAGAAAASTVVMDWIVTSSETIAFTGQTLDVIPVGYQTWSGLLVAAGAVLTIIGGVLGSLGEEARLAPSWLLSGRGQRLVAWCGSPPVDRGRVHPLRGHRNRISKDTMTDLVSSFVDDGSVTIEASDWVLVAIAAGVVGLILGLTGLVIVCPIS